ncbi:MAG: type IV pilus twitching motility protein PilT [candidate division WS1 bacterium]|jgi:twitching motility protein PilT|nr:type IV pilus twitching motility protein PilT [candidate division WS1 bacterium]
MASSEGTKTVQTEQVARKPSRPKLQPVEDVHIDELLELVVQHDASDLHLCDGLPPVLRIDGELKQTRYEKLDPSISQRMIYDILTDEQIQRFETELELDCSYSLRNLARFRVNVFRDRGTVAGAFRQIPRKIPTIRQLGLPPIFETIAARPRGLFLVTGPTGSGKSTTLASVINHINEQRAEHIITIEDPIEYLHDHKKSIINQRELGQDTHAFNNALRASLREDPDVLLVGEMRDLETIKLAITCAETGHLVMATLHTNSAAESVDRMIDVFPANEQEQIRVQLSNNLVAIASQQLLPRAGQPGRVAAIEVMIASSAIRNLVRENKAHQITSIIQTSGAEGMQTMDQALRDLYQQSLITYEVGMQRSYNPREFEKLCAGEV